MVYFLECHRNMTLKFSPPLLALIEIPQKVAFLREGDIVCKDG